MKLRDYIYIDEISSLGDFDDWYYAIMAQHYDGKTFEELDEENQLYVCRWFDKDYLQRD